MHPPAVYSDFHLTLIVVLMIIGGALIGWILCACHLAHKHLPESERRPWIVFLGLLALGVVVTTPSETAMHLSPADKLLAARTTPPLTISQALDQCPPDGPGMTRQVIFTVETESDLHPRVTGCSRMAEQQYLVKGKQ